MLIKRVEASRVHVQLLMSRGNQKRRRETVNSCNVHLYTRHLESSRDYLELLGAGIQSAQRRVPASVASRSACFSCVPCCVHLDITSSSRLRSTYICNVYAHYILICWEIYTYISIYDIHIIYTHVCTCISHTHAQTDITLDRLADVIIHSGLQTLLAVAFHGVGSYSDDWRPLIRARRLTYLLCRLPLCVCMRDIDECTCMHERT